jgi:hypothetical protein
MNAIRQFHKTFFGIIYDPGSVTIVEAQGHTLTAA